MDDEIAEEDFGGASWAGGGGEARPEIRVKQINPFLLLCWKAEKEGELHPCITSHRLSRAISVDLLCGSIFVQTESHEIHFN